MAWPQSRPISYDPSKMWDEDSRTWVTASNVAAGRYHRTIVVIGENDVGQGVVFWGEG